MRRVGSVVRTAQGLAIVRAEDDSHPGIGTTVVDDSLSTVGRIVDVFGPTARPYLAVTPVEGVRPPTLLGETLYAR